MNLQHIYQLLENIYQKYNKKEFVHPDPLEFLYNYRRISDREVAGLIASSFAYGRVGQILISVEKILSVMGRSPREFLLRHKKSDFEEIFYSFKHRFNTAKDLTELLSGIANILKEFGSLDNLMNYYVKKEGSLLSAVNKFSEEIMPAQNYLLPKPENKSPCKRIMLYLRWMVRKDEVDPGGWKSLKPSDLIVPLDTHLFSIAKILGFTSKKAPSLSAAIEITNAFRLLSPDDPVKYDFALTRFGIHPKMTKDDFLKMIKDSI